MISKQLAAHGYPKDKDTKEGDWWIGVKEDRNIPDFKLF